MQAGQCFRASAVAGFRASAVLAIVAWLVMSTSGCAVKRELVITSDPPGALVRLDDTVVGTTPYKARFEAYGTRRITLYHTGYRTLSQVEDIDPPWYGVFPLDVVSEILIPVGWHDRHEFDYHMEPESGTVTAPDLDQVLLRAEALRLAEPTGPRPTIPSPPVDAQKPKPDPPGAPPPVQPQQGTPPTSEPVNQNPVPEIPSPKAAPTKTTP